MKGLAFLFFVLTVVSAGVVHPKHDTPGSPDFIKKQKHLFDLFHHVDQPNVHQKQVQIARDYDVESNIDKYDNQQVVKTFLQRYKDGMLPHGVVLNLMDKDHLLDAEAVTELLLHAKDWNAFYTTACWAREHINEHIFIYALSVAMVHRHDNYGLKLPALYEIMPQYFFNNDVIQKAHKIKMQEHAKNVSDSVWETEDKAVIIESNYSGSYVLRNDEQKLTYFTEDIGLNYMYYHFHLDYPFWMNARKHDLINDRRGEFYYYVHQQLLARYYLERLSNGMGEIPVFSWHWPVENGYYPSMTYPNGLEFPVRPNHFDLKRDEFLIHLIKVEDYERRIRDSIERGYFTKRDGTVVDLTTPESIEHIVSWVEGHHYTDYFSYYGNVTLLARQLLGNSLLPHREHAPVPSALENYQTALRDPVFYSMYKRYLGLIGHWKNTLAPYTTEELVVPGVKIENVEVEKLVTYFSNHDTDITNAVWQTPDEVTKMHDNREIRVRQSRLNHKPFVVTTNVVSEKPTEVVVRIFLGPKYDGRGLPIPLDRNRLNFVELDQFVHELKSGKNTIQRHSTDFRWKMPDMPSSKQLYRNVIEAVEGKEYHVDESDPQYAQPRRLLLPRGRKGGMPFQMVVTITPRIVPEVPSRHVVYEKIGSGTRHLDGHPLGYPFDRHIVHETIFEDLPSIHFEDVLVFHKKESDINQPSHD